ncbi:2878_t:CDS:1 [Ambispora leptoticha]|uniref:2878_t:CDS:1 n=1 Tax=Ambispora leptoticha TaxID=144679 RepID=A0A9N8VFZ3_9GLOM|nr:2878_t:CDS:1 [Ambispora leptoticha]
MPLLSNYSILSARIGVRHFETRKKISNYYYSGSIRLQKKSIYSRPTPAVKNSRNFVVNRKALSLLNSLARGDHERAWEEYNNLSKKMQLYILFPEHHSLVLKSIEAPLERTPQLGQQKDYCREKLFVAYRRMLNCKVKLNSLDLTHMLKVLSAMGDYRLCDHVWEHIIQYKIKPTTFAYNCYMKSHVTHYYKRLFDEENPNPFRSFYPNNHPPRVTPEEIKQHVLKSFRHLLDSGVHPNRVTYSILMKMFAVTGDVENVRYIFDKAFTEQLSIDSIDRDDEELKNIDAKEVLSPDFSPLLKRKLLIKSNKQIPLIPTNNIMDSLIHAYGRAGDLTRMNSVLVELMPRYGIFPRDETYKQLIKWAHEWNDLDATYKYYKMLKKEKHIEFAPHRDIIKSLIDHAFEKGNETDALNIFKDCPARETLNSLIKGYAKLGNLKRLNECLYELMPRNKIFPSVETFNMLIYGYGKLGHLAQMHEIFDKHMPQYSAKSSLDTFHLLIAGSQLWGDVKNMRRYYDIVNKTEYQYIPNVTTIQALIDYECAVHSPEAAMRLLKDMRDRHTIGPIGEFLSQIYLKLTQNKYSKDADKFIREFGEYFDTTKV